MQVGEESAVHLSPLAKLRLAGEIVTTYVRVRWAMNRNEIQPIVAGIRAARVEPEPLSREDCLKLAAAMVRVFTVLPTDSRCLVRSLVLLTLLQRRGVATTLVIGVRSDPEFAAHAWVEHEGAPLLPVGEREYARLIEI